MAAPDELERLIRIETKLDMTQLDHEGRIRDHENRIRRMERFQWLLAGASAAGGGIVGSIIGPLIGQ